MAIVGVGKGSVLDTRVRVRSLLWFIAAVGFGVVATVIITSAWSADAAPGDVDATYVPTAGCRLTDTRVGTQVGPRGAKLGADEVMTVEVHGDNGECVGDLAIPDDAVGLSTNVTVVNAAASSNIRVYRGDLADPPLLSNLNVFAGAPPTPNKVDTRLAPDGTLKVYNANGSVDIVIDVIGYYSPSSLLELAAQAGTPGPQGPVGPTGEPGPAGPQGTSAPVSFARVSSLGNTVGPSPGVASAERESDGQYLIEFDQPIGECAISLTAFSTTPATADLVFDVALPNGIRVYAFQAGTNTRVDTTFHIVATCAP
ncbi:MAG: hypothetical protein AAFY28_19605 [Actinomycetota bacterium]